MLCRHSLLFCTTQRIVKERNDGKVIDHEVFDCDLWHFTGESDYHVFHNACMLAFGEDVSSPFYKA